MKKFLVSTFAAVIGATSFAATPEYILPVDAEASSVFAPGIDGGTIGNLGNDYSATLSNHTYLTLALFPAAERWVSAAGDLAGGVLAGGTDPAGAWISFDLGGQYNLNVLHFANGATNIARNIQDFDIEVSNDNASWTSVSGGAGFTAGQYTIAEPWQKFNFTANDVRYVRINVTNNYGDVNYTNLSKVLFEGTPNSGQYYVDMNTVTVDTGVMGQFSVNYPPTNLTDGTGINGFLGGNYSGATATDTGTENWISASGQPTGDIIFTLPQNTDLQSVILWNGSDGTNATTRTVLQFDLLVSSTEAADDFVEVVTDDTLGITSNSDIWLPGENFLIDSDNVRRVKLRIDSNRGAGPLTMLQGVQLIGRNASSVGGSGSFGYLSLFQSGGGFKVGFDLLTTNDLNSSFTPVTLNPADVNVVDGSIEVDVPGSGSQLFLRVDGN